MNENADNVKLDRIVSTQNQGHGVSIQAGLKAEVLNSTLNLNTKNGIYATNRKAVTINKCISKSNVEDGFGGDGLVNAYIDDNEFYDNGKSGVTLVQGSRNKVLASNIGISDAGVVDGNTLAGIYLSSSNNNAISGNTIVSNGTGGLQLKNSSNLNNIFSNYIGYSTVVPGNISSNGLAAILVDSGSSGNTIGSSLNAPNQSGNIIYSDLNAITYSGVATENNFHRNNTYFKPLAGDSPVIFGTDVAKVLTAPIVVSWYQDTVYGTALPNSTVDVEGYEVSSDQITPVASVTVADDGNWIMNNDKLSDYKGLSLFNSTQADGSGRFGTTKEQTTIEFSNLTFTDLTSSSVTATWETNLATNTQITVINKQSQVPTTISVSEATAVHSVTFTDLVSETLYTCSLFAEDSRIPGHFNTYTDADCTFTTLVASDTTAPVISDVDVIVTDTTAAVTWTTDEDATSLANYGLTDAYGSVGQDETLSQAHALALTGLTSDTTYHYNVGSADAAGNSAFSADATFTTTETVIPPVDDTAEYAESVVNTVKITDNQNQVTTLNKKTSDTFLPFGDLSFTFFDTDKRLGNDRLRFVLALAKKKQQPIVDQKKVFDKKNQATFVVKQELLEVEKKYIISTSLEDAAGNAINTSGLTERFSFTLKDAPQLLFPQGTVSYRMPHFVIATKAQYATVRLFQTGVEQASCKATMDTSGVGECDMPFGVPLGKYQVVIEDARGGRLTQDLYISDLAADGVFVTIPSDAKYNNRITYSGNPTFAGITNAGNTIELYFTQLGNQPALAQVNAGKNSAAVTWNFNLQLFALPVGVHNVRIVDRRPDGSIAQDYIYTIFRTFRPVVPAITSLQDQQTFEFGTVIPATVIGPNDHIVQLFNSAGTLLIEAQFIDGQRTFDLANWFTEAGTYTTTWRSRNKLGLISPAVTLTFTIAPKVVSPTIIVTPAEDSTTTTTETGTGTDTSTTDTTTSDTTTTENTDIITNQSDTTTAPDTDSDGITDAVEEVYELNENSSDSDNDGVSDGAEIMQGTDPTTADTNHDGVDDADQAMLDAIKAGVDPSAIMDTLSDSDSDGLPNVMDSDDNNDGYLDGTSQKIEPAEAIVVSESAGDTVLAQDSDGDGLIDNVEIEYGTNPDKADTDGDGITDSAEILQQTNPSDLDTDNDGVMDGLDEQPGRFESQPKLPTDDIEGDGLLNNIDADDDGDGLYDSAEVLLGTDPYIVDSDGDGVTDQAEVLVGDINGDTDSDGLTNGLELIIGTNPTLADTDNDGLNDSAEVSFGTDPTVADTDNDGLNDGAEIAAATNPLDADTDDDGYLDGEDKDPGSINPFDYISAPIDTNGDGITDDLDTNDDNDGLTDDAEIAQGTNPVEADSDADGITDDADTDYDNDGLDNNTEIELSTNPIKADTDGDGLRDGDEVAAGTDPL
ncbi:MAG: hypothetical protein ACD_43C00200G0001, partial [uncultured bacterium]